MAKYYITLIKVDKIRIYYEFKKLDSKIRIFAATDAITLGCNILDIKNTI